MAAARNLERASEGGRECVWVCRDEATTVSLGKHTQFGYSAYLNQTTIFER